MLTLVAMAATVKISQLPLSTSPSTNTFIEIADMNAAVKSKKYLLTNVSPTFINVTNALALSGSTTTFLNSAGGQTTPAGTGTPGALTNNTATVAGNLVKFTSTDKVSTAPASSADIQTALGQVYQATNANLTAYAGTGTNAILAAIGGAPLVSPALTGTPTINGQSIETQLTNRVLKAGDIMTGTLGFSGTSTLLNLPSLTTAQKNAASAQAGSQVYDSDLGRVQMYDGSAWHARVRLDGDNMSGPLVTPDLLVGGMAVTRATLTHAGTVTLDCGITNRYASITLTGNVTFATANLSAGRWYNVVITMTATNDTPTFPAWKWLGGAPSTLTASQIGVLSLYPQSTTDATTLAAYTETQ